MILKVSKIDKNRLNAKILFECLEPPLAIRENSRKTLNEFSKSSVIGIKSSENLQISPNIAKSE